MTRRLSLVMDEVIVTTERAATSCRSVLTVCRPLIETKKKCGYFLHLYYTYNIPVMASL